MKEYQTAYTQNPVANRNMYDEPSRLEKAHKVVAVLSDCLGETKSLSVLDMSCSTGFFLRYLARHFGHATGIDIDEEAVSFAKANNAASNVEFHVMDALRTSFEDGKFDVVVCNQMYEHVPDPSLLLAEIRRVLVPGGVCYFGATNRLKVIETHYGRLPFLSYLSKPLANVYLRVLGRGTCYYESLHTYWTLKRLCREFDVLDYTAKVIEQPERYGATDVVAPGSRAQRAALLLLKYAYWASPGYIWLLVKAE